MRNIDSDESGSKSVDLGREADNGHSLARLKPMNQVGGKADTCGGHEIFIFFAIFLSVFIYGDHLIRVVNSN